jgi:hypothetical protein
MYNVLNKDGEPVIDNWATVISPSSTEGYAFMVWHKSEGGFNFNICNINTGEYISDKPFSRVGEGFFNIKIEKNGKYNFLKDDIEIELILPQWADSVTDFNENGKAIAVINGEEYILDNNTGGVHRKEGNEFMLNKREEGVQ